MFRMYAERAAWALLFAVAMLAVAVTVWALWPVAWSGVLSWATR